jgi:XTP/dITP diphosphohydrolase
MKASMQSSLRGETLIIATHNKGKLREFQTLLKPYAGRIVSAGDMKLPEPDETGLTFVDNALLKARAAATTGHTALADDSGLCVHALNNEPGIYSARWAGPDKNFPDAMKRIHEKLGDAADRSAHFICVLALVGPACAKPELRFGEGRPDGRSELFEGRVDGTIVWPPRGMHGHGYDPVFMPQGETRTFAEMPEAEKNGISHRGKAVRKLIAFLEAGVRG